MPSGVSSENSLGGGDGAGLGKSECTAGVYVVYVDSVLLY
jgi:hypothetical protein